MFINISTENIILYDTDNCHLIPFRDVEQELTRICIDSYKKYLPDSVYVLNGPGSFTNLRVGALVVNLLLLLSKKACIVSTIDKLSLYRSIVQRGFLPRFGYIFMGQRKNIWYYDFQENTYVVCSKSDLDDHLQSQLHDGQNHSFFVDLFVGEDFSEYFTGHPSMVNVVYKDGMVMVVFEGVEHHITDLFFPTQKMEPYYAMEPNIG